VGHNCLESASGVQQQQQQRDNVKKVTTQAIFLLPKNHNKISQCALATISNRKIKKISACFLWVDAK